MQKNVQLISLVFALLLFTPQTSYAQATRTWVSGVGADENPCSRTAPCKTFAGAISKTAVKGEISVLDPGGYGAVTITKSISIVSEGSEGSILGCGGNGININAAATDVINLHGLFLEGCGNGVIGVNIISAGEVHIRKCLIRGFTAASMTAAAISLTPSSAHVNLYVSDCTIANNRKGIVVNPSGAGAAAVFLDRSVVSGNNTGLQAANGAATIRVSQSVVTTNATGLAIAGIGQIISSGNNVFKNNTTDGAPSSTVPLE